MSSESHQQRVRNFQRKHGLKVDGIDGSKTWAKIESLGSECAKITMSPDTTIQLVPNYRKTQLSESSLQSKYGDVGNESNQDWFTMPYKMYLYGDKSQPLSRHRCHRLMVKPLEKLLSAWLNELGLDFIKAHGLDAYYGCFNNRNIRGGTSASRHARGLAIDLAADRNGNRTPWHKDKIGKPGFASMPIEAINIANSLGWICGATAWGRDAMHFQID